MVSLSQFYHFSFKRTSRFILSGLKLMFQMYNIKFICQSVQYVMFCVSFFIVLIILLFLGSFHTVTLDLDINMDIILKTLIWLYTMSMVENQNCTRRVLSWWHFCRKYSTVTSDYLRRHFIPGPILNLWYRWYQSWLLWALFYKVAVWRLKIGKHHTWLCFLFRANGGLIILKLSIPWSLLLLLIHVSQYLLRNYLYL